MRKDFEYIYGRAEGNKKFHTSGASGHCCACLKSKFGPPREFRIPWFNEKNKLTARYLNWTRRSKLMTLINVDRQKSFLHQQLNWFLIRTYCEFVMGSINSSRDQLDREDSFSFCSYDFMNSAPALFSEDEDYASAAAADDDDDDESYIEIALDNHDDHDDGEDSEEFEIRISLSTNTKIPAEDSPGFETDTIPETPSSSSSTFIFSCSSSGACSLAGVPSEMGDAGRFNPNQKLIDVNQLELVRSCRYQHMQY